MSGVLGGGREEGGKDGRRRRDGLGGERSGGTTVAVGRGAKGGTVVVDPAG